MYSFAVHCAINVCADAVVTCVVEVIIVSVPSNFHPVNVYPVFVGIGNSPYVVPYVTILFAGVTSFPPFVSNVTVYWLLKYAVSYISPSIVSVPFTTL